MSCIPQSEDDELFKFFNGYYEADEQERSEILKEALTPVRQVNCPSVKKSEFVSEIEKLEKQSELLTWIIATLTLEQNQEYIPKPLKEAVVDWKKRFDAMK